MNSEPTNSLLRWARRAGPPFVPALFGLLLSFLMVGPAFGTGALINLDLAVFGESSIPRAMWGLGPDLPRRVPMGVLFAAGSHVVGGELTGKLMIVCIIVFAFTGAHRLASLAVSSFDPDHRLDHLHRILIQGATATIWAAGPFLLTRIAVGFWPVAFTMAVLPWALNDLTDRGVPRRRIFLWSCLFAMGGFVGGFVGGAYLTVTMLRCSPGRSIASRLITVGVWILGQSIWIIPSVVVMTTSTERIAANSAPFATSIDGLGGLGRLFAGMGFWNEGFQLGLTQPMLASLVGFVLFGFAIVGTKRLPSLWIAPIVVTAGLSFFITIASATPALDTAFAHLTSTPIAASLRESQRYLFPFLLWIAIAAPIGAATVARRLPISIGGAVIALPVVLALILIAPSAWGLERQLLPAPIPSEWKEAKNLIDESPGPVLALPWFQYYTSDIAGDRLALSPLPNFLGGDVIAASDPRISDVRLQESADGRESVGASIAQAASEGRAVAEELQLIGVRWVALVHDVNWRKLAAALNSEPGLTAVVEGSALTLYEVDDWQGYVTGTDGISVPSHEVVAPWWDVDPSGPAIMHLPYQKGWLRGLNSTEKGQFGQILLTSGDGPVWFWPALPVMIIEFLWLLTVLIIGGSLLWKRAARLISA